MVAWRFINSRNKRQKVVVSSKDAKATNVNEIVFLGRRNCIFNISCRSYNENIPNDELRLTSKDVLLQLLKQKAFVLLLVAEFHHQRQLLLRHSQGNLNGCSRNIRSNKMLEHWKESQIFPFCPRRLQKPFHCALHVLWHSVKATSIFIYVSYLSFQ